MWAQPRHLATPGRPRREMPDRTQAVHLTKQVRHSWLVRETSSLPKKTIMSSTAVTVAGIAAHVILSNDVVQSCLSMRFLQTHIPRKSRSSVVELVVTASLNLTSFTCVLEFVLDPNLHLCDTVLCQNAEMLPLVLSLERLEGLGE
jgi:hypothetical protein